MNLPFYQAISRRVCVTQVRNQTCDSGIVGVVAHRVSAADPLHAPANLSTNRRRRNQVVMIGQRNVGKDLNLKEPQSLSQNILKRSAVALLAENRRSQIPTIEGTVQPACFASSWWSFLACQVCQLLWLKHKRDRTPFIHQNLDVYLRRWTICC